MCRQCDHVEIHRLLRANAPLDAITTEIASNHVVNLRSPCGKSPLMTAADAIEWLVQNGAVVNAQDEKTGDTAGHYITLSMSGHIRQCACLMALIEAGAEIGLRNYDGYTVFDLGTKNGNQDIGSVGDT